MSLSDPNSELLAVGLAAVCDDDALELLGEDAGRALAVFDFTEPADASPDAGGGFFDLQFIE